MRIHALQHVAFEGLAQIEAWARTKGHPVTTTRFHEDGTLPEQADFDWLVIMGGPMNIYEEDPYPWLVREKRFVREAVDVGKTVLGICLGAQLLADVLGGKVFRNPVKEIGWHPVEITESGAESGLFGFLPKRLTAFHWHGDTFHLPPGAVRTATSVGCPNQAFLFGDRVVGLQFHLESTPESIEAILANCADELVKGPYIQDAAAIRAGMGHVSGTNAAMTGILDRLEAGTR